MAKKDEKEAGAGAEDKDAKDAKKAPATEGAEGEAAPAEGEAAPKKSKKKLIIIAAALVVLLGGGAGAYFALFSKHEVAADVELGPDGKPLEKPVFYTMPEFLVNLNSGSKQTTFLKATIILEVPHQADIPQIEANLPRLLDAINTYMRELRASDLAGSAGIQRLREEVLLRVNKTIAPVKVNDVLFKEIIVQ